MWRIQVTFYDDQIPTPTDAANVESQATLEAEVISQDITGLGYVPMSVKVYQA